MGDFNLDLLKFQTHRKTNDCIESMISKGYLPLITKPTRVTTYSATLIDHIYSNDMMEKRKRAKNTQSYDEINQQVKRACIIAKENWLEEQFQEIENLEKEHLTKQMHEKIPVRITNLESLPKQRGLRTNMTTCVLKKKD